MCRSCTAVLSRHWQPSRPPSGPPSCSEDPPTPTLVHTDRHRNLELSMCGPAVWIPCKERRTGQAKRPFLHITVTLVSQSGRSYISVHLSLCIMSKWKVLSYRRAPPPLSLIPYLDLLPRGPARLLVRLPVLFLAHYIQIDREGERHIDKHTHDDFMSLLSVDVPCGYCCAAYYYMYMNASSVPSPLVFPF